MKYKNRRNNSIYTVMLMIMILFPALLLCSCARAPLYTVDIGYAIPPDKIKPAEAPKNVTITVAKFNDLRNVDDKMVIGRVMQAHKSPIPIFPKFYIPSVTVTRAVRAYMNKSGYAVATGTPDWNLSDDTIAKEWGDIVIGGDIHEFELICIKERPIIKYTARVKLTAVFADVTKQETKLKVNVESSPSLEHIRFTEGKMAEVINDALTAAVNKIFENEQVHQKLKEIVNEK